jgi:exopolysaccharide production protein ExoQ
MRLIERPGVRSGYLVLVLFTLLAGDVWRYTVSWAGFGVIAVVVGAFAVLLLVSQRRDWRVGGLPYPLIAFLALATASLAWSYYPGATALGLVATWLTVAVAVAVAVTYSWSELLRGLGTALRLVLGLSLLFEFVVAAFIRNPVLPPVAQPGIDYANLPDPIPKMLYWSRNELFEVLEGGQIQGIVGNSALLSFIALLGLIVFAIQLADKTVRTGTGIFWILVAAACFVFTRSATNLVGLVAVALVVVAVLIVRRARTPRERGVTYGVLAVVAISGGVTALLARNSIFELLGKSSDLTNRGAIWDAVIALAQERPVQGWGWISYWVPWVSPYDTLAFNNGVRQLHAHNAWLDVWLQLGILGLIVFGALVLSSLVRAWSYAVDRPQVSPQELAPYTVLSVLPVLLTVALLVQSFTESRLLVEYGLFLLFLIAVKTKRQAGLQG